MRPSAAPRAAAGALAGIVASAVLFGLCAQGGLGWVLGFVALVPWLLVLAATRTLAGTLLATWAMTVAFTAAAFPWFGSAIGRLAGVDEAVGLAILLAAAPLFQPQFFAFALVLTIVRRAAGAARRPWLAALAGAAAWVAAEWLVPKLLGDTLGYGLHPSRLMRQAADVVGAGGLTLLLLGSNVAVAAAIARRRDGVRAVARPLALAVAVPLVLAAYGQMRLATLPAPAGPTLRMGLVQSNIVDYERLRRDKGSSGAVVREVLDTHYAMTYDAVERQRVQAVLWSETVYPTTFARPKSEAGAELDREIAGIVNAAGVPFVFGTYDRDDAGEYNAAAFVAPGRGLVGFYRKTRPFPLTEHVPAWLDSARLRQWLPWAGSWRAGDGARVMPLVLAGGREVPVLPMICLDTVDSQLAIDGARLGATLILTMSNDSWFTDRPLGAELHQAVAAFRSIETRLPQFRVTSNGYSAVIDATGTVLAGSRMGERTLVVGELPVSAPPRTLMVMWGDWVGRGCALALALWAVAAAWRRWSVRKGGAIGSIGAGGTGGRPEAAGDGRAVGAGTPAHLPSAPAAESAATTALPATVALLPPAVRIAAASLRIVARGSLLAIAAAWLFTEDLLPSNTLALVRMFAALFVAPELAATLLLAACRWRLAIEGDQLVFTRGGGQRIALAARDIAAVLAWRLRIPAAGAWLRLTAGERFGYGLAPIDAAALARALAAAGGAPALRMSARAAAYAQARAAVPRGRLDRAWARFVLLPFVLAVPAFRLHQHIAYGGTFGELQTFGPGAYLIAFALWWAAWAIGVVVVAAVLRAAIEAITLAVVALRPARAAAARRWLEQLGRLVLYVGLPAWLLLRLVGG